MSGTSLLKSIRQAVHLLIHLSILTLGAIFLLVALAPFLEMLEPSEIGTSLSAALAGLTFTALAYTVRPRRSVPTTLTSMTFGPGASGAAGINTASMRASNLSKTTSKQMETLRKKYPEASGYFLQAVMAVTDDSTSTETLLDVAETMEGGYASPPTQLSPDRVSAHESAHAVVANSLGSVITHISRRGNGVPQVGGFVEYCPRGDLSPQNAAYIATHVALAGWLVDLENDQNDAGSLRDLTVVRDSLLIILSTGRPPAGYNGALTEDLLREHIMTQTQAILDETVQLRADLAAGLMEHSHLSGRQFYQHLKNSTAPRSQTGARIHATLHAERNLTS